MKHSKLYTHLGIAGALLIPALAVAAVEIPNVFEGGNPVSASEMNDNFKAMADAIDALEAKVETLENAGLQPPVELSRYAAPAEDVVVIYQVHTDGIMASRSVGNGFTSSSIRFDVSTSAAELPCTMNSVSCSASLVRGHNGSSGSVFVPAGYFVAVQIDELVDEAWARIDWQPLRGPDPDGDEPTLIESSPP